MMVDVRWETRGMADTPTYEFDPDWLQPADCFCVVRNGVWHVSWLCPWHGGHASSETIACHQPIIKRLT